MFTNIDISGTWQLSIAGNSTPVSQNTPLPQFYEHTLSLPGSLSQAQIGEPSKERATGYLTDPYAYTGILWVTREVSLPEADCYILHLERTRITTIFMNGQYVGTYDSMVGFHEYDLSAYAMSGTNRITIAIDNANYATPGGHMTSPDTQTNWTGILGAMEIRCYSKARIQTTSIHKVSGEAQAQCELRFKGLQESFDACTLSIRIGALWLERKTDEHEDFELNHASNVEKEILIPVRLSVSDQASLLLSFEQTALLWDEWEPRIYELCFVLTDPATGEVLDTRTLYYGLREFTKKDLHFQINGHETFLRGKHDGMIFPLTGYAPMDLESWLRVMSVAKDYGINHYRFHTCCPPEAAFLAADLLGIYMQPELSFWGTFQGPNSEDYDEKMTSFLREEGFRMLSCFATHPSYCMMSMGNELWGDASALNELVGGYKAKYPHILYAQGSNNFFWTPNIQPNDDFFSGVRFSVDRQLRASFSAADTPYGHIQTQAPGTTFRFDDAILPPYTQATSENSPASVADENGYIEIQYGTGVKRVKASEQGNELIPTIPVIAHEVGQYEIYPDYKEIPSYTGVLKPYNLEIFRDRLKNAGLMEYAEDYLRASGALTVSLYKDEIESMLRSRHMAGFQLLDLQDFTGQGTALVGVLNAFYESKGIISANGYRHFCNDAVIQAEFPSYLVNAGEDFTFDLSMTYYRKELPGAVGLTIALTQAFGGCSGSSASSCAECDAHENGLSCGDVHSATRARLIHIDQFGYQTLGSCTLPIPPSDGPSAYTLTLTVKDLDISNSYTLWSYPEKLSVINHAVVLDHLSYSEQIALQSAPVAFSLSEACRLAASHKKVLLFLSEQENIHSVEGFYTSDFWNYGMFRSIAESIGKKTAPGTLGLLIQQDHPALKGFPTRSYATPQWFSLVMASASTILDGTGIRPIVRSIDNFDRNHNLGLLYELHLTDYDCSLLVCTSHLPMLIEQNNQKEAAHLYASLLQYLSMESTKELISMDSQDFIQLVTTK